MRSFAFPALLIGLIWACGPRSSPTPSSPTRPVLLGEPFPLRVGETVTIEETALAMTFSRVVNDSRCPKDVTCIRAGEAILHFILESARGGRVLLEFRVPPGGGDERTFDELRVGILELHPQAESGRRIEPSAYVATVRVERMPPASRWESSRRLK